jgi:hypothetical protein
VSWTHTVPPLATRKPEAPVYEDFFPLGLVPPDLCPLHGHATGHDVAAQQRPPSSTVTVQRVLRPDGTVSIMMRGGG